MGNLNLFNTFLLTDEKITLSIRHLVLIEQLELNRTSKMYNKYKDIINSKNDYIQYLKENLMKANINDYREFWKLLPMCNSVTHLLYDYSKDIEGYNDFVEYFTKDLNEEIYIKELSKFFIYTNSTNISEYFNMSFLNEYNNEFNDPKHAVELQEKKYIRNIFMIIYYSEKGQFILNQAINRFEKKVITKHTDLENVLESVYAALKVDKTGRMNISAVSNKDIELLRNSLNTDIDENLKFDIISVLDAIDAFK